MYLRGRRYPVHNNNQTLYRSCRCGRRCRKRARADAGGGMPLGGGFPPSNASVPGLLEGVWGGCRPLWSRRWAETWADLGARRGGGPSLPPPEMEALGVGDGGEGRKFVNSYTVDIPPRCPPRPWNTHRRLSHAASLTRVCGSNRVPRMVWTAYVGAPVPLYCSCVLIDAKRAMRGQAFGASGPSCWTDVRCLRAITSTAIRPVPQPRGTVQTSSPRAVRTWTWSGRVRAISCA